MDLTFDEGKLFYELYAAEFVEENPANLLASDLEIVNCCKTITCRSECRTDCQSVLVFLDGLAIRPTTIR